MNVDTSTYWTMATLMRVMGGGEQDGVLFFRKKWQTLSDNTLLFGRKGIPLRTDITMDISVSDFEVLTLDKQIEWLDEALTKVAPAELLKLCGGVRDHAPLAWLCAQLLGQGWFGDPINQNWFAGFMVSKSETSVDKVNKALLGMARKNNRCSSDLAGCLLAMMRAVSLEQLSIMCLVDRALKHNFSKMRDEYIEQLFAFCLRVLDQGSYGEITAAMLAQMSSDNIEALRKKASECGSMAVSHLKDTHEFLARKAIEVIGNAPKGVSQSNAEELLARRVYTDPGHFLIELLQNAEDANAVTWKVVFDKDRIVVWHDGKPFDTRDLVGVTSIGQTTKRKEQIGFFGVGFKAIYEVTDRPQIYSDVYNFEIADISVPKALASRPSEFPTDGTLLILPFRETDDPKRTPKAFYKKACLLDPVVLFTLRDIDVIELSLTKEAGGPAEHTVTESFSEQDAVSTIRQIPDNWTRTYMVQDHEYPYDSGPRMPGKPTRTKVMVGVRLGDHDIPIPLDADTSSVYSYLPTSEYSGLSFFVQGHFDVPVDRERLTQDSRWNRWILSKVPLELARVFEKIVKGKEPQTQLKIANGFLEVLPLDKDLGSPIFREILCFLPQTFEHQNIIPCTDGKLHSPKTTMIVKGQLHTLLEDVRIEGWRHGAYQFVAESNLGQRGQEVGIFLGCCPFGVLELVSFLEKRLRDVADGTLPRPDAFPAFLNDPTAGGRTALLYRVLSEEIESTSSPSGALKLKKRIRQLPILLAADGGLYRAESIEGPQISIGGPAVRKIYGDTVPFICEAFDSEMNGDENASMTILLQQLGVRKRELRSVVTDMENALKDCKVPLQTIEGTAFPGNKERLCCILESLVDASFGLQTRVARLPVFTGADGLYYPRARNMNDTLGVLTIGVPSEAAAADTSDAFYDFYNGVRPVVHRASESSAITLLNRLNTPALGINTLVSDLSRLSRFWNQTTAGLHELHGVLDNFRDRLSGDDRRKLEKLPIWPDCEGHCHVLRGPENVKVASCEEIHGLFPGVPFLDEAVAQRSYMADMRIETIGTKAVVDALSNNAKAPLKIEIEPQRLCDVHLYLLDHWEQIGNRTRAQLSQLRVFLSDTNCICALSDMAIPDLPRLRDLYGEFPGRTFVKPDPIQMSLISNLNLEKKLQTVGLKEFIADLQTIAVDFDDHRISDAGLSFIRNRDHLMSIWDYFADNAHSVSRGRATSILKLPLFLDNSGKLGRIAVAGISRDNSAEGDVPMSPCLPRVQTIFERLGIRVVDKNVCLKMAQLIEIAGIPVATVADMVFQLANLGPVGTERTKPLVQSGASLNDIHELLVASKDELLRATTSDKTKLAKVNLSQLNIWPTVTGEVVSAAKLVDVSELVTTIGMTQSEIRTLGISVVADHTHRILKTLDPIVKMTRVVDVLPGLIENSIKKGQPVADQGVLLNSVARIGAIVNLLASEQSSSSAFEKQWPMIDLLGRVRFPPLKIAVPDAVRLLKQTTSSSEILDPEYAKLLSRNVLDTMGTVTSLCVLESLELKATDNVRSRVNDHPVLCVLENRMLFYSWLVSCEKDIFTDETCRTKLTGLNVFQSTQGTLLSPSQMVMDPELWDLGVDWKPHEEIPPQVLSLLRRHLDIGTPHTDALVQDYLMPAYQNALQQKDGVAAGRILSCLATQLHSRSKETIELLLQLKTKPFLIEATNGEFVVAENMMSPVDEFQAYVDAVFKGSSVTPNLENIPTDKRGFLYKLGVRKEPTTQEIRTALDSFGLDSGSALALCALSASLYQQHGEEIIDQLSLSNERWLLDGSGQLKAPGELFEWQPAIEALIGDSPGLYPDMRIVSMLGEEFLGALGLKTQKDVRPEDVFAHIVNQSNGKSPVSFKVYQWMEQGIENGRLVKSVLIRLAADKRWILSDDGEYYHHREVLGFRALQYFGNRRGYWEHGIGKCPLLCRCFSIPRSLTPEVVTNFLTEIGTAVTEDIGNDNILQTDAALPRMLFSCYRFLGDAGHGIETDLPILLCKAANNKGDNEGNDKEKGVNARLLLLAATNPLVFRSDTPTLNALFQNVGPYYLVCHGSADEHLSVARFHKLMNVRLLRQTYTVEVDEASVDKSAEYRQQVAQLVSTMGAVHSVLPRIKLQRTLLDANSWVDQEKFRHVTANASVQVVQELKVSYHLQEVGSVQAALKTVYDPERGRLLIDTMIADSPDLFSTDLAQTLVDCIYDGPGSEQLIDILDILLPLKTRKRMEAYLDRRHFPVAQNTSQTPIERLQDRLAEILDYGFGIKLKNRFIELKHVDLSLCHNKDAIEKIARQIDDGNEYETFVHRVTPLLLDRLGVSQPTDELRDALLSLLLSPSLSDIPFTMFLGQNGTSRETPNRDSRDTTNMAFGSPDMSLDHGDFSEEQIASIAKEVATRNRDESEKVTRQKGWRWPSAFGRDSDSPSKFGILPHELGKDRTTPDDAIQKSASMWSRLARWIGIENRVTDTVLEMKKDLPPWATTGGNCLSPTHRIPPQLWATPEAQQRLKADTPTTQLQFSPTNLPSPYSYAVQTLGCTFDEHTQQWTEQYAPRKEHIGVTEDTGKDIVFEGILTPGIHQLPVPLHSHFDKRVVVVNGVSKSLQVYRDKKNHNVLAQVSGDARVTIRYRVSLFRLPSPSSFDCSYPPQSDLEPLRQPIMGFEKLPPEVQFWLTKMQSQKLPVWQKAVEAQYFVQTKYLYDEAFMDRPEVQKCLAKLKDGNGSHHLSLLHASGDNRVLGRGICYELNTLVTELLRHLAIPSMVATGWTLKNGILDRPDHLFSVGIFPGPRGMVFFPLDAAVGAAGPIRSFEPARSMREPFFPNQPLVEPVVGPWNSNIQSTIGLQDNGSQKVQSLLALENKQRQAQSQLLRRAIEVVCQIKDKPVPFFPEEDDASSNPMTIEELENILHNVSDGLLCDVQLQTDFLSIVKQKGFYRADQIDANLRKLLDHGYVKADPTSMFQLRPASPLDEPKKE